jgi:hypothetical protein
MQRDYPPLEEGKKVMTDFDISDSESTGERQGN